MLERLHKVLANAGFGSRRACEQMIAAGEVFVDGKPVTEMGVKVDPAKHRIKCRGRYLKAPTRVVLLLNKPKGVVTTVRDERGRKTVLDCLKGRIKQRLYPAGRLDAESTGAIVLTNDGDLCHRLTHPSFRVSKTYHVVLKGVPTPDVLEKISKGVWLSEGKTEPMDVRMKKQDRDMSVAEVQLHEGMNREVRRVFAKFGLKVKRLRRVRIGKLDLGSLGDGQFRFLDDKDVRLLLAESPRTTPVPARSERDSESRRSARSEEE